MATWTSIGGIAGAATRGTRTSGNVGLEGRIVLDTSDVEKRLAAVDAILDKDQLLEAVGFRWLRWIDENLTNAGQPNNPWQVMRPNTIAARPTRMSAHHFSSRFLSRLRQTFITLTGTSVEVGTNQEYADFHHYGTRPYDIYPVKGKFLKFQTAGGTVFSKHVRHPGLPARQLIPTKEVAEQLAQGLLDAYVRRAEDVFNRGNATE